ncbi:antA/AntB antirepressor family protein [Lacticaseibacillus absianus]|uniref:antA/AntB antirepressor family protein n=1 Tax=Lacticaseibacillus absianus TaxID=2729623 RepID=UPI0015C7858D|nr:antA/AntB antirepressor family protein [Lacticaseibacillus absianus]
MNELIQVTENDQHQQVVSARELYKGLEIKTRFSLWVEQNFKSFDEHEDFEGVVQTTPFNPDYPKGKQQQLQDYALTIDMAKNLALMSKTARGAMYRAYLIDVERKWNDPAEVIRRGYALLLDENKQLKVENAKMVPKVEYFDTQMHNPGLMTTTIIEKAYGKSAKWLNAKLSEMGIIFKQGKQWVIKAKYAAKGYTGYDKWGDIENQAVHPLLKWTQRGEKFIYDELAKQGIRPIAEQMNLVEA